MITSLKQRSWWPYIEEDLRSLLEESLHLLNRAPLWRKRFHDYAFVVFPAAKAYEGFLKKLFLDLGFISQDDYYGKRFRIGKSLNPALEKKYREESVYDDLVQHCSGQELPDQLWQTWKQSRNLLFHWFPNEKNAIGLEEAKLRVLMIIDAIDQAYKGCKIKKS